MEYVIFDFEWNNAYDYKTQKGLNEIIEIGAVKLNEYFEIEDTFKQLVKPSLSNKFSKRFVELTGITFEEVNKYGISFSQAFKNFSRWAAGNDVLFMSWSNSDLYVLVSDYINFTGTSNIEFINKYLDAQKYCQTMMNLAGNDQISLSRCAEMLHISVNEENLHRALEDCCVAAKCFKSLYKKENFNNFICCCDKHFFAKLAFKPYYLNKPVTEFYNLYKDIF
ncbi:MAG: exonuclease domain-containing protein, partial [Clostridiales bacterium]|nr:exonuclease domain-containing protein [Clostridiales bacterium]